MKFSEYARSKGRAQSIGDDLYARWNERKKSFSVSPKKLEKNGILFELKFHGAPFRVRTDEGFAPAPQEAGESFLSSWLPTICVGTVGSEPTVQFKFASAAEAERAWNEIMRAKTKIRSIGDLNRIVKGITYYPESAARTIVIGRISFTSDESREIAEIDRAASRVLDEIKNPLSDEKIMEIAERVGPRLAFMLGRVGSLFRAGSSRALYARERVKRITGVDYALWVATAEKASQSSVSPYEVSEGAENLMVGQDMELPLVDEEEGDD